MSEETKAISDALGKPFPKEAVKQRPGGGSKMLDYIDGTAIIRRLNDATGNNWSFHLTRLEWHADLLMATGELTIPGMGTRTGIGVQKVSERGGEDLVKGASTDALKKAATLFGVALELYGPDIESVVEAKQEAAKSRRQSGGVKADDEQKARITATVEAGGGNVMSDTFNGWLSKNSSNNALSLDSVLAEDVEGLIAKLNAINAKRKAAAS
jgi:hypothetical protein